jgi:hypothetical protein
MAQDPEQVDPSADLDEVIVFRSSGYDAEMEATSVKSLLEANGIDSMVVGTSVMPVFEFQVQAPRAQAEEAQRLIAEAQAAGPEAAAEAEAETEQS